MQSITLKHISKLSGFSISTISKALNGGYDISESTKLKIIELAKSKNYIPNNSALALRNRKTKLIGVIVPKINSRIYSNIVSKIQEKAFKQGYRILLLQSLKCEQKEFDCINNVRDGCVDGVILIKPHQKIEYSLNKLRLSTNSSSVPIVIEEIDKMSMLLDQGYIIGEKSLKMLLSKIEQS